MADDKKLPSVRDHAYALRDELIEKGDIAPDASSAAAAAGLPVFSKGTATLDENTGRPITRPEAPEFTAGETIAVPEDTSAEPLAAPQAAIPQAVIPDAGAAAAEAIAEQIADAFAEHEEFELDDPDLNVKIPVRVPKQYAETAKRGYGRRAAYDRSIRYLKEAEPVLRQLIEDGRIQQVLPLLKAAIDNQAYGEYVASGFQRLQQGLPLIEQARQEIAAQAQEPAQTYDLENEDPFFAERIRPYIQGQQTLQQRLDKFEAERQAQAQQQQEEQRVNNWRAEQMQAAHQDLARSYPDQYSGDLQRDTMIWQRALKYAKDAGYVDAYGLRAGIVFAGQQVTAMEKERLTATASPTATALQAAENQHMALARQQAAAASRTVGGGAPSPAPPPAPRPVPTPRSADGKLKPAGEFLREQQAYLAGSTAG